MGLDNPIHIAFLLILLLLVFGAKRLPEMGRSLGTGMRGFKESLGGDHTTASLTAAHQQAPVAAAPVAEPVSVPLSAPVAAPAVSTVVDPGAPVA